MSKKKQKFKNAAKLVPKPRQNQIEPKKEDNLPPIALKLFDSVDEIIEYEEKLCKALNISADNDHLFSPIGVRRQCQNLEKTDNKIVFMICTGIDPETDDVLIELTTAIIDPETMKVIKNPIFSSVEEVV